MQLRQAAVVAVAAVVGAEVEAEQAGEGVVKEVKMVEPWAATAEEVKQQAAVAVEARALQAGAGTDTQASQKQAAESWLLARGRADAQRC